MMRVNRKAPQQVVVRFLAMPQKRSILLDPEAGHFGAIAIAYFMAEATAQTGLTRSVRNSEKTAPAPAPGLE